MFVVVSVKVIPHHLRLLLGEVVVFRPFRELLEVSLTILRNCVHFFLDRNAKRRVWHHRILLCGLLFARRPTRLVFLTGNMSGTRLVLRGGADQQIGQPPVQLLCRICFHFHDNDARRETGDDEGAEKGP